MSFPAEILAVGAALCYCVNGMIAAGIRGRVTVREFTILQLGIGSLLSALIATFLSRWGTIAVWQLPYIVLSGVIGPMLTALAMTAAIFAIGPRLATLVFSFNVPFSVILAYLLLGEDLLLHQVLGIAVVCAGIMLALQPDASTTGGWIAPKFGADSVFGLFCGLGAALSQAIGSISVRPVMAEGADAFAATALRTGAAMLCLMAIHIARTGRARVHWEAEGVLKAAALKAFFGVVLGMTLLLAALSSGKVAVVAVLSSLSPVLILPMAWAYYRARPGWKAWAGAVLTVVGCAGITGLWTP